MSLVKCLGLPGLPYLVRQRRCLVPEKTDSPLGSGLMAHEVDVPEYVSRCLKSMAKYQSAMKLSSKDSKAECIQYIRMKFNLFVCFSIYV